MKWRLPRSHYRRRAPFRGWKSIPPAIRMVVLMTSFAILSIITFNLFEDDIKKLLTPTPSFIIVLGALLFIILDNNNKNKRK
jgi:hypothetical protein